MLNSMQRKGHTMPTNKERVNAARRTLLEYKIQKDGKKADIIITQEDITDLMTDLRHFCKEKDLSFSESHRISEGHYHTELGSGSVAYDDLAKDIMENYPEYSFCLICEGWNYTKGVFSFRDPEDGRKYKVTTRMIAEILPKMSGLIEDSKLHFYGMGTREQFMDACSWDAISTDAAVQIAIFGKVIYG